MAELVQIRRPGAESEPAKDASLSAPTAHVVTDVSDVPPTQTGAGKTAYVETYGCQMNVADSELLFGMLDRAGYGRADSPDDADVILINTCAVREKAEERVFGRASLLSRHKRAAKKNGKDVVIGIAGCMAEHLKGKIQERAPYVDMVLGPDSYRRLADHLEDASGQPGQINTGKKSASGHIQDTVLDRQETYEGLDPARLNGEGAGVTGHVTIQRGCDKFCTFCIVPYTRGRERGTPPREVLRQTRALAAAGYKEVQLLGQTVNSYRYEEATFADLLRAVAQVDGIERIRFTSPYPLDFSDEVIAAMAETDKVCKHVHLPLQAADDAMLARMKRGYTYEDFRVLVRKLRAAMPDIGITTDILVGFCDETEEEFEKTLAAQAEIQFDSAFMFAYSEREGTFASKKMPDTVPEETKRARLARVIELQQSISSEKMQKHVGKTMSVLISQSSKRSEDQWMGRADNFASVIFPKTPDTAPGQIVQVRIDRASSATLFGTAV